MAIVLFDNLLLVGSKFFTGNSLTKFVLQRFIFASWEDFQHVFYDLKLKKKKEIIQNLWFELWLDHGLKFLNIYLTTTLNCKVIILFEKTILNRVYMNLCKLLH